MIHSGTSTPSLNLTEFFSTIEGLFSGISAAETSPQKLQATLITFDNMLATIVCTHEWDHKEILKACHLWNEFFLSHHCDKGNLLDLSHLTLLIENFKQIHGKEPNSYFCHFLDQLAFYPHQEECKKLCIDYLMILGLSEEARNDDDFTLEKCGLIIHYYSKVFQIASHSDIALPELRVILSGVMLKVMIYSFQKGMSAALAQDLSQPTPSLEKLESYILKLDNIRDLMQGRHHWKMYEVLQKWLREHKVPVPLQEKKARLMISMQEKINALKDASPPSSFIEEAQAALQQFRHDFQVAFDRIHVKSVLNVDEVREFQRILFETYCRFFENNLWKGGLGVFFWVYTPSFDLRATGSIGRQEMCPYSDFEGFTCIKTLAEKNLFSTHLHVLKLMFISMGETPSQDIPGLQHFACKIGFFLDPNPDDNCDLLMIDPERFPIIQKPLEDESGYPLEKYILLRSTSVLSQDINTPELPPSEEVDGMPIHKQRALRFIRQLVNENKQRMRLPNQVNFKKDYITPLFYLIHHLGIYFDIPESNTLDIIEKLKSKCLDDASAALLKEGAAALYYMRVRIQFAYGRACDEVLIRPDAFLDKQILLPHERQWLSRIDQLIIPTLYDYFNQQNFPSSTIDLFAKFSCSSIEALGTVEARREFIPRFREYIRYLIDNKQYSKIGELYHFMSGKTHLESIRKEIYAAYSCSQANRFSEVNSEHELRGIKHLLTVPHHETGYRFSYLQQYQKLADILKSLTTPHPTRSADGIQVRIETACWNDELIPKVGDEVPQPETQILYLNPSHFETLFDMETLKADNKRQNYKTSLWLRRQYPGSLHRVVQLKNENGEGLHFKERPTHAAMEFAIVSLFHRLFGRGATPSVMARLVIDLHDGETVATAVAISLSQDGSLFTQLGTLLDSAEFDGTSLSEQLIGHVLILPTDAHRSNLMLAPLGQVLSLDLEASFIPFRLTENTSEVSFVSELFCHDMIPHLSNRTIESFKQVHPGELLSAWLKELSQLTQAWSMLFKEEKSWLIKPIRDPTDTCQIERDLCCVIPSFFYPGTIARLYHQIVHLQRFFESRGAPITPLDLLSQLITCWDESPSTKVGEYLASRYRKSRFKMFVFNRPWHERLSVATGKEIQASQSSTSSLGQLLRGLPTYKNISQKTQSPENALDELFFTRSFYESKIPFVNDGTGLRVPITSQVRLNQEAQKVFLNLLFNSQGLVHLSLPNFTVLTDTLLTKLIQTNGHWLRTLDLRGCVKISFASIASQFAHLSNLEALHFSNQHLAHSLPPGQAVSLPALKEITLENVTGSSLITLNVPSLQSVKLKGGVDMGLRVEGNPLLQFSEMKIGGWDLEEFQHFLAYLRRASMKIELSPISLKVKASELKDKLPLILDTIEQFNRDEEEECEIVMNIDMHTNQRITSDSSISSVGASLKDYQDRINRARLIIQLDFSNETVSEAVFDQTLELVKIFRAKLNFCRANLRRVRPSTFAKVLVESHLLGLDLSFNQLCEPLISEIIEFLPNSSLTHLVLRGDSIGDESAFDLLEGVSRSKVIHLDLSDNEITTLGILKMTSSLCRCLSKGKLILDNNKIGPGGNLVISQCRRIRLKQNEILFSLVYLPEEIRRKYRSDLDKICLISDHRPILIVAKSDFTISKLVSLLRNRIGIGPEQGIFLFMYQEHSMPPSAVLLVDYVERKKTNFFVYVGETTID